MIEKTFLLEIGTEELPSKKLDLLAQSLANNLMIALKRYNLPYGNISYFSTPRRLAIKVENLVSMQSPNIIKKIGPPVNIAFDINGNLTRIAKEWADQNEIVLTINEHLQINEDNRIFYLKYIDSKNTTDLIPSIVDEILRKIHINKSMRWGDKNVKFIRPVHTVTLLLGDELIKTKILGMNTNRFILCHRFMGLKKIKLENADQYPDILQNQGYVIANYTNRKQKIQLDIENAAMKLNGIVHFPSNLLDEVTSLVEWPVILVGKFDKKFLTLPKEILVYIMNNNQKYFAVHDNDGMIMPYFIFVANIESNNPNKIIQGNEKIILTLLSDAKSFFEIDCFKKLDQNLVFLKNIIFQKGLGSLRNKTYRIQNLSCYISKYINANIEDTHRAALLSKCDLITPMVFEFPEMQGIIGMYYAINNGENHEVSIAIKEHYYPRFLRDHLPNSLVGSSLSIADKLDTIVGLIGISKHPKNDKDPFALRRAAIGILHIIINKKLDLDLKVLITKSIELYNTKLTNLTVLNDVMKFILNRLCYLYRNKGYEIKTIKSVLSLNITKPLDFDCRIKAISSFLSTKQSSEVILINKRLMNILAKSNHKLNDEIQFSLLQEKEEIQLVNAMLDVKNKLNLYLQSYSYNKCLIELSKLNHVIINFFDTIMVNCPDHTIRINRLNLIFELRSLFLTITDFSLI